MHSVMYLSLATTDSVRLPKQLKNRSLHYPASEAANTGKRRQLNIEGGDRESVFFI